MITRNYVKKKILKHQKEQIKRLDAQGLYSVFSSKYFIKHLDEIKSIRGLILFYNYAKKCDNMSQVIRGSGQLLEELVDNKNYSVAIVQNESKDAINKVMKNGIDSSFEQLYESHLNKKFVFANNIIDILYLLKQSSNDKIVLKIPSDLVKTDGSYKVSDFSKIFNTDDITVYVKPEFIDSFISINENSINRRTKNDIENNLVKKIKPTE